MLKDDMDKENLIVEEELEPEEDFELSELQENFYSQIRSDSSEGIIGHLTRIGKHLTEIPKNAADEEEKFQYFEVIDRIIEEDGQVIQGMIDELDEEVPEQVAEITDKVDEKFAAACHCFLDVIDLYTDYLDDEDPKLLEDAKVILDKGSKILNEASKKADSLSDEISSS